MSDKNTNKSRWIAVGLLSLVAMGGGVLWYWFSQPNASADIEKAVQQAANSMEESFDAIASQEPETQDDDESLTAYWSSFGNVAASESSDTSSVDAGGLDQGSGPPASNGGPDGQDDGDELLSLEDAESLLASARVLSRLPTESINPELAADPRVRQILETAKRITTRRGLRLDSDVLAIADFSELSEAEKLSIAKAVEAQIASHAFRFEQAAFDQSIESIWRTESHLRVLHKDLKELLPSNSSLPDDPLSIAPTEILQKAVRVMQTHRQQLQRQIAILGIGSYSADFQVGRIYALVDKTIHRIQVILDSEEHAKFQAEKGDGFKKISKKKWTEASESHAQRFATEASSRLNVLHAELGWQELREGAADIRGPPLDAIVWSSIRDFDTNVRRWLQAESCVRALCDEITDLPEVRNVVSSETKSPLERVSLFLNDSTLRRGLLLANSIVSKTSQVEDEVFPGRREHFEEIAAAFHKEISRRDNGGSRLVTDTSSIEPLVNRYTDLNQPAVRAEARMLSLAAQRFPKLNLLPENIKSDIRSVQSRAIGRYAERIAQVISGYQEVANYLALATDPAPELLEKLKGARAELKAINSEFVEMVEVAKMYGTDVESAKAILVQLECLFPRGPPEENPPPTFVPRPDTPPLGGGGVDIVVGTEDLKRIQDTPKTTANPSLEKCIYFASARLGSAESIVESTLRDAAKLDAQPVAFAMAFGRIVLDPNNVTRDANGEIVFHSIKPDMNLPRLSNSLKDWEGRLKEDPLTGKKVPFDHRTEVKNPKSFKAVGGGIHFGEMATTDSEIPNQVYALRYESGNLFLQDGRSGERHTVVASDQIDATSLKALFRFATANRNAAISIGWAMEKPTVLEQMDAEASEPGSAILLDPFLVDTAVGQDLILADTIPWKFGEETLPNGAPVTFNKTFAEAYNSFRKKNLDEVSELFISISPFKDEERSDWIAKLERTDAPLVIQVLLRKQSVESAREFYVKRSVREILEADGTNSTDDSSLQSLRRVIIDKFLESNGISSLDKLNSEGKRLVTKLATERVDEIKTKIGQDFNDRVLPLIDNDTKTEEQLVPVVDVTMSAMLANKNCPTALIELWASLLLAKEAEEPLTVDTVASGFLARLNSTTLAILYDDEASFSLAENAVSLEVAMKYRYATSLVNIASDNVTIGDKENVGVEIKTISSLTDIVNENIDSVEANYPPLQRVIQHAALEAFLKWAIAKQGEGVLIIDLSELATVPAHDPVKTPTPDRILK